MHYPEIRKVNLHKSGLVLLGIGIIILVFGLSVQDKQLTIENGNAIVGALLSTIGIMLVYLGLLEIQHDECIEDNHRAGHPRTTCSNVFYCVQFRAPLKLPVISRSKLDEVTVLQANIMLYRCSHSL